MAAQQFGRSPLDRVPNAFSTSDSSIDEIEESLNSYHFPAPSLQ